MGSGSKPMTWRARVAACRQVGPDPGADVEVDGVAIEVMVENAEGVRLPLARAEAVPEFRMGVGDVEFARAVADLAQGE